MSEWQQIHAQIDAIVRAIPEHFLLDPPDGGDVTVAEGVQRMAARIEQLEAALRWMPIETAPKIVGEWIVAWFPNEGVNGVRSVIRWSDHYDSWYCNELGVCLPTHWMPLPQPPAGETNE